jgi:hypothetical protein
MVTFRRLHWPKNHQKSARELQIELLSGVFLTPILYCRTMITGPKEEIALTEGRTATTQLPVSFFSPVRNQIPPPHFLSQVFQLGCAKNYLKSSDIRHRFAPEDHLSPQNFRVIIQYCTGRLLHCTVVREIASKTRHHHSNNRRQQCS